MAKVEIKKLTEKQQTHWDAVREYMINECPLEFSYDGNPGKFRIFPDNEHSYCFVLTKDGRWYLE